jgi:hypothetical protein
MIRAADKRLEHVVEASCAYPSLMRLWGKCLGKASVTEWAEIDCAKREKRMWHPEIESGSSRVAETPQREVLTTILVPLRCRGNLLNQYNQPNNSSPITWRLLSTHNEWDLCEAFWVRRIRHVASPPAMMIHVHGKWVTKGPQFRFPGATLFSARVWRNISSISD